MIASHLQYARAMSIVPVRGMVIRVQNKMYILGFPVLYYNAAQIKLNVTGSLQTTTPIPLQKVVEQMPHRVRQH